jgi:hypothetical protein
MCAEKQADLHVECLSLLSHNNRTWCMLMNYICIPEYQIPMNTSEALKVLHVKNGDGHGEVSILVYFVDNLSKFDRSIYLYAKVNINK